MVVWLGVVVHARNSSTGGTDAGDCVSHGQSGLHGETSSHKRKEGPSGFAIVS